MALFLSDAALYAQQGRGCEPDWLSGPVGALDGLADGRLRPVQLGRGSREAPLGGDGEKDTQLAQIHEDAPAST